MQRVIKPTCLCGNRDLQTVKEVCTLHVMRHISPATLYRLVDSGAFPHRRVSPKKVLILVTGYCPVHERKIPDGVDAWLNSMQ